MFERDYLMRMIKQLTDVLTSVLFLRQNGQVEEAINVIDRALHRLLGFDLGTAEALTAEKLVALVRLGQGESADSEVTRDQLIVLGSLLREAGEIIADQGDAERGDPLQLKSLEVFLTVLTEDDPTANRAADAIEPLLERLSEYELPPMTKARLWRHFEDSGRFAKAEDWLYELIDGPDAVAEVFPSGAAFYERLLSHTDAELEAGNLPRDEVLAGLEHLRELAAERARSEQGVG